MEYNSYFIRGDMIAIARRNGNVIVVIHYGYNSHNNTCVSTEEYWDIPRKEAVKILKKYLDS